MSEARASIGRYLTFYNGRRPHSSLDRQTPDQAYFNRLPQSRGSITRQEIHLSDSPEAVQTNRATSVLDQKQTSTGHIIVRQVIDGQQRLITLQIFIAAYRDFCRHHGCSALADEFDKFVSNTGMMADPEVDKYKVWPTQLDRLQFMDVINFGSCKEG